MFMMITLSVCEVPDTVLEVQGIKVREANKVVHFTEFFFSSPGEDGP